jgi:hypothetical protein
VDHQPGAVSVGRNVPEFLDAQTIDLRRAFGIERIAGDHLLAQMPRAPSANSVMRA